MAIRKRKKKEEFEASLMSGYLPGAVSPVTTAPVSAVMKLPFNPQFLYWHSKYIPRYGEGDPGPKPEEVPMSRQFLSAWAWYGLAGIADPKNFAEASAWSRLLKIPYLGGYAVAGGIGFFVTGLVLTAIDPLHKWEGGLDETAFYQRRVTNAERMPEWGSDSLYFDRANEKFGWGVGARS